ncbi:putative invertase inhibitor [Impatiens glandulifera]|uniref:putative invertase inhibitor n=1 Tax=Impatiens glandulifera TaxID=253017 RepID=UPI001FB09C46|nr:putative invertase inhibitor [Impatiens glandulifera]
MMKSTNIIVVTMLLLFVCEYSSADLIYDTCQKTKYSSLCESTLRANFRMATSDVKGLGYYMFETSLNQAITNNNQISSLIRTTKDPASKKCLSICSVDYKSIIDNIHLAVVKLNSNAFTESVSAGNAAIFADWNCEGSFANEPTKPQSPITGINNVFFQLTTIAINIVQTLK